MLPHSSFIDFIASDALKNGNTILQFWGSLSLRVLSFASMSFCMWKTTGKKSKSPRRSYPTGSQEDLFHWRLHFNWNKVAFQELQSFTICSTTMIRSPNLEHTRHHPPMLGPIQRLAFWESIQLLSYSSPYDNSDSFFVIQCSSFDLLLLSIIMY